MSEHENNYELSRDIERFIAALSTLYAQDGKRQLQEIIVNAHIRVVEAWSTDNWNGGTYGHALYLQVPESVFVRSVREKDAIESQIKEDLNKVHNVQNEFIEEVFLEMAPPEDHEWRKNSGLLLIGNRTISLDAITRIWGQDGFRVFLSHKSEVKKEAAELKDQLRLFGISSFVAHEDIRPTKAWQDEIENALGSMDGFVALMTPNFHDSDWTDQEVGFAFGRGVPIIAVRLGKDPYGFIGKFQALSSEWKTAAEDIVKLLIKNDKMFAAYVRSLRKCTSWENGNELAKVLPILENITSQQIDELLAAYNETPKLHGSFGFNGSRPTFYGRGLVHHLNRLDKNRKFKQPKAEMIEIDPK